MANPIPITTTDPDGDGTVSVTITDLTHPNAFSTDGVNFNGTASFGGITALQQTLNLDHSVTLTGDLSHLTITSTVASTDVLQVDAHNSEGGDIFGFIDWPVVSPDLGGPTAIGFSMNPQAGNSLASLGTFFQIGDPDLGDTFTYSIGAGSASGFVLTPVTGGASLNATGAAANTEDLLNVVATDAAGNATTVAFHVWLGDNGDNTHTALFSTNNIDDGLQGIDKLNGGSGTDYLFGGSDSDTLQGNGGADFLAGGNGNDIFKYAAVSDSISATHDLILDFTPGTDKVDLGAIDANLGLGGDQAFTFDSVQNAGTVAGHITWLQDAAHTETIIHAGVVGDGTLEIHLAGIKTLTAGDFIL